MAKRTKKNETDRNSEELNINAHILGAGEVVEQHITDTLEVNYYVACHSRNRRF